MSLDWRITRRSLHLPKELYGGQVGVGGYFMEDHGLACGAPSFSKFSQSLIKGDLSFMKRGGIS